MSPNKYKLKNKIRAQVVAQKKHMEDLFFGVREASSKPKHFI